MGAFLDTVPPSGIIRIRDMMFSVKDPFRLDQGDVSFDAPDALKKAMMRAIADNRPHYVQTAGIPLLRERLAEKVRRRNGVPVGGPDDVLVANGGIHAIYAACHALLEPGAAPTARALCVPFAAWEEIHESGGIFGRDGDLKLKGLPGRSRDYFEKHFPELGLPHHLDGTGWWNRRFETEEECHKRAEKFLSKPDRPPRGSRGTAGTARCHLQSWRLLRPFDVRYPQHTLAAGCKRDEVRGS